MTQPDLEARYSQWINLWWQKLANPRLLPLLWQQSLYSLIHELLGAIRITNASSNSSLASDQRSTSLLIATLEQIHQHLKSLAFGQKTLTATNNKQILALLLQNQYLNISDLSRALQQANYTNISEQPLDPTMFASILPATHHWNALDAARLRACRELKYCFYTKSYEIPLNQLPRVDQEVQEQLTNDDALVVTKLLYPIPDNNNKCSQLDIKIIYIAAAPSYREINKSYLFKKVE